MGFVKDSWCPLIIVIMSSSSSVPIAYMLNKSDAMKDERLVCCAGIVCLFFALVLPVLCIRQFFHNVDALIYAITPLAFKAFVSVFLGFELDGLIEGFCTFYVKNGEPYLSTTYGTGLQYWDGFNYTFYLTMIALYFQRFDYKNNNYKGAVITLKYPCH